MSVNIKPLEDRIVVKALDAEQTTASGLVIPDTAKEKPQEGEVIAVGPGRFNEDGDERIPMDISVGDKVIYSKYGGTEVKYSGEEYLILSAPRRARDRFLIHSPVECSRRLPPASDLSTRLAFEGVTECPRSWSSTRTLAARSSAASTSSPTPSR